MPIRFRCQYCNKLLGIARRKAGTETVCPHCGFEITVPNEGGGSSADGADLGQSGAPLPTRGTKPLLPVVQADDSSIARGSSPPVPDVTEATVEPPATIQDTEPPLFEKHLDEVLGVLPAPPQVPVRVKPKPDSAPRMDAVSVGTPGGQVLLTPQKATILVVGIVLLLALAFGAGFLIAAR